MSNDLLNLIVTVIVFGVGLWLINAFIPMAGMIKSLLNLLILVVLLIYIFQYFGLIHNILPTIRIIR